MIEQADGVVDDPIDLERTRIGRAFSASDAGGIECDDTAGSRKMRDLHLPVSAWRDLPGWEKQNRRRGDVSEIFVENGEIADFQVP